MVLEGNRENQEKDEEKIKELTKGMEDFDVSFYIQGRLMVKKCRETLKCSYIHSYYNLPDTEDHILKFLQESLAMCIEKLAQALQKPAQSINPPEIRKATRISGISLENLLSHICGEFIEKMEPGSITLPSTSSQPPEKEKKRLRLKI